MLRKEEKLEGKEKYPWLDDSDERKYMTDKEVLERYINLDNSCLNKWEKRKYGVYFTSIKMHLA